MSGRIKFYHPDETLVYNIQKCLCKTVWINNQSYLMVEIETTDELDHVDEDSIQNEFSQIRLTIDDFPIQAKSVDELMAGYHTALPSSGEAINVDGESEEVFYTNLEADGDYETFDNRIEFDRMNDCLHLKWVGYTEDFTESSQESAIKFKVDCIFDSNNLEIKDYEDLIKKSKRDN